MLEASKDPGGARVIEAFLNSNASTKHKRKLVIKYVISFLFPFLFILYVLMFYVNCSFIVQHYRQTVFFLVGG